MDNTELIHSFIDGTLDQERESELFMALNGNEELRQELKEQMAMKEAIKGDVKAFTPSAQSTLNIFNRLNFTPPAPLPKSGFQLLREKVSGLFTHYSQAFIGAAIGTAATVLLIFMLVGDNLLLNTDPKPAIAHTIKNMEKVEKVDNKVKVNTLGTNEDLASLHDRAQLSGRTTADARLYTPLNSTDVLPFVTNSSTEDSGYEQLPQEPVSGSVFVLNTANHTNPDYLQQLNIQTTSAVYGANRNTFSAIDLSEFMRALEETEELYDISFELGGNLFGFFTDRIKINPAQMHVLNNYKLSLFSGIGDHFEYGLDLRQETYYQKFSSVDSSGNLHSYEQQPNVGSIGAFLRFLPYSFEFGNGLFGASSISPYIQAGASYSLNRIGPVARCGAGFMYSIHRRLTFNLGAEYNRLYYRHDNKDFTSDKLNVSGGIILNF